MITNPSTVYSPRVVPNGLPTVSYIGDAPVIRTSHGYPSSIQRSSYPSPIAASQVGSIPRTSYTYATGSPVYTSTAAPLYTSTVTPTYVNSTPAYVNSSTPVYTAVNPAYVGASPAHYPGYQVFRPAYPNAWSPSWVSGFSRYAPSDLRSLFDRYDRNRSGYITFDELRALYNETGTPISDSALAYVQSTYDKNRDGRLSYPEFHEFVTGRPYTGIQHSYINHVSPSFVRPSPIFVNNIAPAHYPGFQVFRPAYPNAWSPSWVSGFSRYAPSDLRSLFDRYDRDRSGYITFDELRALYNETGTPISDSALAYVQSTYDKNRDGRLSYPEFYEFVTGKLCTDAIPIADAFPSQWNPSWVSGFSRYSPMELRSLFDRYDRDRSGYITFDELRVMYDEQGTPISDSALAYLQNTYDRNRDGRLSYPEFHEFVTGRPLVN
jgi:Ca2+-binding EF-hand superfamily protein